MVISKCWKKRLLTDQFLLLKKCSCKMQMFSLVWKRHVYRNVALSCVPLKKLLSLSVFCLFGSWFVSELDGNRALGMPFCAGKVQCVPRSGKVKYLGHKWMHDRIRVKPNVNLFSFFSFFYGRFDNLTVLVRKTEILPLLQLFVLR